MLFGSELFEEYIGQLAMASMASMDIFIEGEQFDAKKLQEKMKVHIYTLSDISYDECLLVMTCLFHTDTKEAST